MQTLIRIYHEKSWGYKGPNFDSFYEFLTTFLNFSKLISSLKEQVYNILKSYIDNQIFLLNNIDF